MKLRVCLEMNVQTHSSKLVTSKDVIKDLLSFIYTKTVQK